MNILICVNPDKEKSRYAISHVCRMLNHYGITPLMPYENKDICSTEKVVCDSFDKLIKTSDMLITIGGDGTILRWGRVAAEHNLPLLGINTGRLGFMATLEFDELEKLKNLKTQQFSISKRMLMDVKITGRVGTSTAINDVVIYKHNVSKLPEYSVRQSEKEVLNIRADGIIFSTATGSTAYSLSAGGPIIQPEMKCIEMTPLCAHTLFARPMVFDSDKEISIGFIPYDNSEVYVSVDGMAANNLNPDERVVLTESKKTLKLVDIDGSNFYDAINTKLMRPLK
ncbi:MAG: NAD(+)/NADH kinase [Clostridiales bacterium]|nr:NAD(+)/NADH kinase [Clostridiales bacterium]